jgi:hypothetical protein
VTDYQWPSIPQNGTCSMTPPPACVGSGIARRPSSHPSNFVLLVALPQLKKTRTIAAEPTSKSKTSAALHRHASDRGRMGGGTVAAAFRGALNPVYVIAAILGRGVAHFLQHVCARHRGTPEKFGWMAGNQWDAAPKNRPAELADLPDHLRQHIARKGSPGARHVSSGRPPNGWIRTLLRTRLHQRHENAHNRPEAVARRTSADQDRDTERHPSDRSMPPDNPEVAGSSPVPLRRGSIRGDLRTI